MSGMSALWASLGIGASISAARTERQKAAIQADLKYLYSAFTKIPCLRLAPDWRARLIRGYEEFPFDSAVPLYVFKNLQALEISSIDFRQFFGWDRVADQLRSLTLKRAGIEDPADILIDIVLDDMDKRRRRTSKSQSSPTTTVGYHGSPRRGSVAPIYPDLQRSMTVPMADTRTSANDLRVGSLTLSDHAVEEGSASDSAKKDDEDMAKSPRKGNRPRSNSPSRPGHARNLSTHVRSSQRIKRSGSGSSHSSLSDSWHYHSNRNSTGNLLAAGVLPPSKWRFLRHLSLSDNAMTSMSAASLAPLSNTLYSLDLSANLFSQIPDSLASLTALRALNLAHCMIDSLHSLTRNPLPAITALNLRANRLQSLAGVEKLFPLERLDLRDNRLTDPSELARLTGIPDIREVWVEGNPFVRTHKDYRITIFNLFRKTPGYTEDISIDGSGPSYSERRSLVDRALIPDSVPVVKPDVPEIPAVDVNKPAIVYGTPKENAVLRKDRPIPKAVMSEVNTSSSRRRKTPKRRIVDLATGESPQFHSGMDSRDISMSPTDHSGGNYQISPVGHPLLPPVVHSDNRTITASESIVPTIPRVDTNAMGDVDATPESTPGETQKNWSNTADWDAGENYRLKIEALRDKVGSGYLSVLGNETWDAKHTSNFVTTPPPPPPVAPAMRSVHTTRAMGQPLSS